jgi:hypothetical protein
MAMFWTGSLVATIVIGTTSWASYALNEPHWLQRGGALLAALAAMLAIFEALLERNIDNHSVKSLPALRKSSLFGRSAVELANRIVQTRFRSRQEALSRRKLAVVFFNAMLAVLGEILHGFGDLFVEGFLFLDKYRF